MEQLCIFICILSVLFSNCAFGNATPCVYPRVIKNAKAGDVLQNGTSHKDFYKVNETVEVNCKAGYMQHEPEVNNITCLEGGKWSVFPKCEPMGYCTNYDMVKNGTVQNKSATPFTNSTFKCDTGYDPTIKEVLCTRVEDTWDWKFIIVCEKRRHVKPEPQVLPILHGHGELVDKHKIQYTCCDGYEYIGSESYTFDENGRIIIPPKESFPVCIPHKESIPVCKAREESNSSWMLIIDLCLDFICVVCVALLTFVFVLNMKNNKKNQQADETSNETVRENSSDNGNPMRSLGILPRDTDRYPVKESGQSQEPFIPTGVPVNDSMV